MEPTTDDVSPAAVVTARKALHALAEHLLAGPMYRYTAEIALAVTATGFATTHGSAPDIDVLELRLRGTSADLVAHPGGGVVPVQGSARSLGEQFGLEAGPPDLYGDHADLDPEDDLGAEPAAVVLVLAALRDGAAALRQLAPDEHPILWPEHFDVGISTDAVNYGVSPGDSAHDLPYAYVGPWTRSEGAFWNETFGASRPVHELGGVDGILEFFRAGRYEAGRRPETIEP